MSRPRPATIQISVAVFVLAIGVLVYLLDRPSTSVYFVPDGWEPGGRLTPVFGLIGDQLPTFAHTFAFALFTSALLEPWRWSGAAACTGWWIVGSLFECAQRDEWAAAIAARLPFWFDDWPLLDNVAGYFVAGRYDWLDLVSIATAALCAFAVTGLSRRVADG